MNIGLLGLDFGSSNLGCGALSYSFLHLLNREAKERKEEIRVFVFTQERCDIDLSYAPDVGCVEVVEYHLKKLLSMKKLWQVLRSCDVVFDFTSGDSFSDIYGVGRVLKSEFMKTLVIASGANLVLGPQTYGPFRKSMPRQWAKWIFCQADKIYARDDLSADCVKQVAGIETERVVDVAFALPYNMPERDECPLRVGLNVSGLLWNGGYTEKNQFGLKTDYKRYCSELVHWLKEQNAEVHLIGHVFAEEMPVEDDAKAAKELNALCGECCVIAPRFRTPMEAKSYIAGMDVFVGARMHSTIAALSSGCAVIPFAYSRKFKGLYNTLSYPYLIEAAEMSTEDALQCTRQWIADRQELRKRALKSNECAGQKLEMFFSSLRRQIDSLKKG